MKIQNQPNRAAFDTQGAQDVRSQFQKDPQSGLKAAAQQFETMFLQMVLKSMRDTVPSDGLLSNDQTRFYNSLLDQQMAQNLSTSGRGVGFAQLIERQLGGQFSGQAASGLEQVPDAAGNVLADMAASLAGKSLPVPAEGVRYRQVGSALPTSADYASVSRISSGETVQPADIPANAKAFVDRVWPDAVAASRSTGIPPQFLVAHAALESGWGKSEIRRPDGSSSHNLFGVKAGQRWSGDSVNSRTTEYVDGAPLQTTERFRAYGSYSEAFQDYANLLRSSPRYSGVIGSQNGTEFAQRLQQAGYATDPKYAEKLARIIDGPTLRQALIG